MKDKYRGIAVWSGVRCGRCGQCLEGAQYVEAGEEAVCGPCYHRHHADKCARCGLSLHTLAGAGEEAGPGAKIITCNQETFHVDCYTCKVTL